MRTILMTVVLAIFTTTQVSAGFFNDRGDWDKLSDNRKDAYIMGAIDRHWILTPEGIEDGENELVTRQATCILNLGLNSADLLKLVDEAYAADVEKWTWPPLNVVINVVYQMCPRTEKQ